MTLQTIMAAAARSAVAAQLLEDDRPARAHCMACGRDVNVEKAALGGRHRFCSTRCLEAFDAGWPVYGTTITDYQSAVAHRKPTPSRTKTASKRRPRKRVLKAREAAAEPA